MARAESTEEPVRWYRQPFRMFQTNLLEVDADMDVEKVLDFIEDFGCDTWLVNGGGILSFYPTALEHQTRNPYLDRRAGGDLFGDAVAAGHRRGIRVLARMDFSKINKAVADRHHDWLFVNPQGGLQEAEGQVSVDPAAGYYQDKLLEVVDEMIDRYPLDGFFFNRAGFNETDYALKYHGVSQSEASKRGFAEYSGGQQLPTGPDSPNYDLWRTWGAKIVKDLWSRVSAHIKERRPDAALLRSDDLVFFEANNKIGRDLWHHHVSEMIGAFRTQRPLRAVLSNSVAFIDMPYRIASEQPEHLAQHLIQSMSRGANISTYIMGVPNEIEYPALDIAREITRFHRDHNDVYRGLIPAAHIGLVRPDTLAMSARRFRDANDEFRGLYEALQEVHLPFDVVPLEGIADMAANGGLKRYSVLLLADVGPLPPQAVEELDRFVAAGGRLVLTGSSGFDPSGAAQLKDMPATRITEAVTDADALKSTYVTERPPEAGRHYHAPVSPVFGAFFRIEPRIDARGELFYLPQAPYGPPEKCYGHVADGTPGYYISGAGSVALIPWTIGRSYHELALTTLRDIVVQLVGELLGEDEPLRAELSDQVELTLQRRGDELVVHLDNLSGAHRMNYGPFLPIAGGKLRLAGAPEGTRTTALVAGAPCATHIEGRDLVIDLPVLGRFEVIHIEPGR